jgi:RNA polymerase sigma-70 factor, ECF subfamily
VRSTSIPVAVRPEADAALREAPVTELRVESSDYDALFRKLYPMLFRYLHRMTGDVDVAEDLAQEAFVRLIGRHMPEDEARVWLFTVATNLFRDRTRTGKRRDRILTAMPWKPNALPGPEEDLERTRRIESVRAALERIPARDRQMLLMREEGFRYEEIAKVAEVAPGSVGTLLARATKRFLAVYDNHLEDG